MATDVLMPQMGESIAEGTIVKWLKKVGDKVQRDEPLLEISTDKVDAEIPAPAEGVLTEILAKEGDTVAVNSVIARLGEAGEAGAGAGVSAAAAAGAAPAAAPPTTGEYAPAREEPSAEARQVAAQPAQADGDSRPLPSHSPALPQRRLRRRRVSTPLPVKSLRPKPARSRRSPRRPTGIRGPCPLKRRRCPSGGSADDG